jgi:hypothetical protein
MLSALLAAPTGLCMTRSRTVWSVCSGWGSVEPVYAPGVCAPSVSSLPTAVCTARVVTRGTDGVEVFWNFSRVEVGEWPVVEPPVPNFMRWASPLDPASRRRSALGTVADPGGELFDVIEDLTALGHLGEDLLLRVHHRGVVPAERLSDLGQRQVGELAGQIHGDLS